MKFLISGITGFVGPHLASLLVDEGHEVTGLLRSSNGRETDILEVVPDCNFRKIKFSYADITNSESIFRIFDQNQFDGVFHLAAQSHPPTSFMEPQQTFLTNCIGTINTAEAIRKFNPHCRLMLCSTSEVYGAVPEEKGPINEEFPIAPINPYGVSKAAADMYVRERAASCMLPFFITRAFSHTGPRRGRNFSISSDAYQIARIKKGYQEPIIKVGTLSSKRVVMDVRDCIKAYYLLMLKFKSANVYNVGGDKLFAMGELLDMMLDISGLKNKIKLEVDPSLVRPIDIPVQICDSSKCRNLTGWKPTIPIEQTLKDLLAYWENKIDRNSCLT